MTNSGKAGDHNRWRSVTVFLPPDQVRSDEALPAPLAALGDSIEVDVRPAPGGKGTEIAARLRQPEPSGLGGVLARVTTNDPRQDVRAALRDSKQLLEVGQVLKVDPIPSGQRKSNPAGKVLGAVTRRAGREGVV